MATPSTSSSPWPVKSPWVTPLKRSPRPFATSRLPRLSSQGTTVEDGRTSTSAPLVASSEASWRRTCFGRSQSLMQWRLRFVLEKHLVILHSHGSITSTLARGRFTPSNGLLKSIPRATPIDVCRDRLVPKS